MHLVFQNPGRRILDPGSIECDKGFAYHPFEEECVEVPPPFMPGPIIGPEPPVNDELDEDENQDRLNDGPTDDGNDVNGNGDNDSDQEDQGDGGNNGEDDSDQDEGDED